MTQGLLSLHERALKTAVRQCPLCGNVRVAALDASELLPDLRETGVRLREPPRVRREA